jgi:hypothetical protein
VTALIPSIMERTPCLIPRELARCPQLAALRRRRHFGERPLCAEEAVDHEFWLGEIQNVSSLWIMRSR